MLPPDVPKDGTWLDLPLAIIMLQAAGYLPDLPERWPIWGPRGFFGTHRCRCKPGDVKK